MTLQQLRYFQTACRYGNITRAAEVLQVSQPSISAAIKGLENEFGLHLICRQRAGFTLTADGEALRRLADELLEHADRVVQAMDSRGRHRHIIHLGIPPMAGAILFPAIYAEFCARHPEIELFTQEVGRMDLVKQLDDGLLDLAFLPHTEPFPPAYRFIPVKQFQSVCCVSPDHPFAKKETVTPADLDGIPLVFFSRGFFQNERITAACAQYGITPRIVHTSSQISTVSRMIASGTAVGFLFDELLEEKDGIIGIPFSPPLYTRISLVWKKDRYPHEGMKHFIEYIRAFTEE